MINFDLTNAIYFMDQEQIRVMEGDSVVYEGTANLMPYWLTKSTINHIKAAENAIVFDVNLVNAFSCACGCVSKIDDVKLPEEVWDRINNFVMRLELDAEKEATDGEPVRD